ncbi:MAG TPA: hypothetical protein VMX55_13195 [candidate division Zixibacteria bacterium]|nr:hypothetical protein [candidate division Zixibacteria bacterium]
MKEKEDEKEFEDIIDKTIPLKKLDFTNNQKRILRNPRYRHLLRIIHLKAPIAFDEMLIEYQKLEYVESKSESTVYRLLQTLKDEELVIEIGKRVIEGQILTKSLYSLTANFYILDFKDPDWTSKDGKKLFFEALKIIKLFYKNKTVNEMKYYEWICYYQKMMNENHVILINSNDPELLEIISAFSHPNIQLVMKNTLFISILLQDENLVQKLDECFLPKETELKPEMRFSELIDQESDNYTDVILKFPEIYYFIDTKDPRIEKWRNYEYQIMFGVLELGPLPMSEIIELYNEISIASKKSSTIYRYIKNLKNDGLVLEAGRRVIQGKRATEKLIGLSGKWIVSESTFDVLKEKSYLNLISERSELILKHLFPDIKSINSEKFRVYKKVLFNIEQSIHEVVNEPENLEMKRLLTSQPYKIFIDLYAPFADTIAYLRYTNIYDDLYECITWK